jgi:hypothetical protein
LIDGDGFGEESVKARILGLSDDIWLRVPANGDPFKTISQLEVTHEF